MFEEFTYSTPSGIFLLRALVCLLWVRMLAHPTSTAHSSDATNYKSSCHRGQPCNHNSLLGLLQLISQKTTQGVRDFSDIHWELLNCKNRKFSVYRGINNDRPDRVCKFTEHVLPCNWYQERAFYAKCFAQNIRHPPLGDILVPFEAFFYNWLASLGCTDSNWKADTFRHECRSW